jgi:hypothetical protein
MTQQEHNEQIALMLGIIKKNNGQIDYWPLDYLGHDNGKISDAQWNFKFHSDWNWIMGAVDFIRSQGWGFNLYTPINGISEGTIFICTFCDHEDNEILGNSSESPLNACFVAVSYFAKLFNDYELNKTSKI